MPLVELVQILVVSTVFLVGRDRFLLMLPIGVHCALGWPFKALDFQEPCRWSTAI